MNITEDLIRLDQSFSDKNDAIKLAGQLLVDQGLVDEGYIEQMILRDDDVSTFMGNYIAIPHGTSDSKDMIKASGISIVQVPDGVEFSGNLVTVVFGIAGKDGEHLDLLSQIAILCSDIANVQKLADANSKEAILTLLQGGQ
ncbi:PTS sugar transporter subunit IIA [Fundicoccus culcitae]|uniref:Mannitol-specific phosphotransferase enzyme IIA component n=1 Tax=Fundicoccus culcitae TaxID=2969821 RepID=A0ABY5P8D0_9LACT|nr:PTS sugar transporter subunit IIA [Fundicoccus culcitae]UUX35001.1 PTS sugar transporter subunit IIA [Fundicoccus culcitae]